MSLDFHEDTIDAIARNWEALKEVDPKHPLLRFVSEVTRGQIKFNNAEFYSGFAVPYLHNLEYDSNKGAVSRWQVDITYQLALEKAVEGEYKQPKLKTGVRTPFTSTWRKGGFFNLPTTFLGPNREDFDLYNSLENYFRRNSEHTFLEGDSVFQYLMDRGVIVNGSEIGVVGGSSYLADPMNSIEPLREKGNLKNKKGLELLAVENSPNGWRLKGIISDHKMNLLFNMVD